MYRFSEHTADIGLHVTAPDLAELLAEAGRALFAIIVLNIEQVEQRTEIEIYVAGTDPENLLVDWLSEWLYIFEHHRLVLCHFEAGVESGGVRGRAKGEPLDLRRHRLGNEVKAITYHELMIRPVETGWEAKVIVDV